MSGDNKKCFFGGKDVFVAQGKNPDGSVFGVRHRSCNETEAMTVSPMRDGEPLSEGDEVVELSGDGPSFACETIFGRKGPAKVASPAYREGWDSIFGTKEPAGEA